MILFSFCCLFPFFFQSMLFVCLFFRQCEISSDFSFFTQHGIIPIFQQTNQRSIFNDVRIICFINCISNCNIFQVWLSPFVWIDVSVDIWNVCTSYKMLSLITIESSSRHVDMLIKYRVKCMFRERGNDAFAVVTFKTKKLVRT